MIYGDPSAEEVSCSPNAAKAFHATNEHYFAFKTSLVGGRNNYPFVE